MFETSDYLRHAYLRHDGGVLRLQGKDARDLLQRLSTNDVLKPFDVKDNVLTTEKGKIIDVVTMILRGDTLWLVTRGPARLAGEAIDKMIFREDVTVAEAPWAIAHVFGSDVKEHGKAFVVRGSVSGVPGTHVVGPRAHVEAAIAGLTRVPEEAFEQYRVSEGIAAYGREITGDFNPHEARLGALIDWEKGCYVGQEVVARLDTYKKVQRTLLRLRSDQPLKEGAPVLAAGEAVGGVTSAAGTSALAYVKLVAEGAPLTVGSAPVKVIPW